MGVGRVLSASALKVIYPRCPSEVGSGTGLLHFLFFNLGLVMPSAPPSLINLNYNAVHLRVRARQVNASRGLATFRGMATYTE